MEYILPSCNTRHSALSSENCSLNENPNADQNARVRETSEMGRLIKTDLMDMGDGNNVMYYINE